MKEGIRRLVREYLDQPLLTFGEDTWSYGDAVLVGLLTGSWTFFEARVRQGLALEAAGREVPDEEVEAALVAFRRERRLLAREDLRAWMDARGLDGPKVAACVRRSLLRRAGGRAEALRANAPPHAALAEWLAPEAFCSRVLTTCADQTIRRAAAQHALDDPPPAADPRLREALLDAALAQSWRGFRSIDPVRLRSRAEAVLRADAAHRSFVAGLATDDHLERQLVARRLDLTRVTFDTITLSSDSASREAVLCVRVDGMALPQVAARAGVACRSQETEVDALEDPLRAAIASGRPGELVGPLRAGDDGYAVAVVRDRRTPMLQDDVLRRRLTDEVVGRALERHAAGKVRWHGCV